MARNPSEKENKENNISELTDVSNKIISKINVKRAH
jgi:hypothetical protein